MLAALVAGLDLLCALTLDQSALRAGVESAVAVGAFGVVLILLVAVRREADSRLAVVRDAVMQERRRLAHDLHDGLAQDLALIAAHGDRIAREAGVDHPVAIAARRALAISRTTIADLSASHAPTTGAALRLLAAELAARFELRVDVEGNFDELNPSAREDVVRITREAIVNAARANACHVVVSLRRDDGRFLLRVLDDGHGISPTAAESSQGFGLRGMRERAASLGGALKTEPSHGGGTELSVVFP